MHNQKMTGHTNLVAKKIRRNSKWLKITTHQKTVITKQTRTHRTEMHPETHPTKMHTERTHTIKMHMTKMHPTRIHLTKTHMIKMRKTRILTIMEMRTAAISENRAGRAKARPVFCVRSKGAATYRNCHRQFFKDVLAGGRSCRCEMG